MNNQQKFIEVFAASLGIATGVIRDNLKYNEIPEWDSVGHMALVTGLETKFEIMLDTNDIIDMNSVGIIKKILKEKYGVSFEE